MRKKQEIETIREYAKNYHYPISDIKGFNETLKDSGIKSVRRITIKKLLNY